MNRRDVVQRIVLGGTILVVMPSVLTSCSKDPGPDAGPGPGSSPITIDLSIAGNSSLNTTGGSKIVQNIIVINTGSDIFVALSSICTHQGCTVGYNSGAGNIQCPCHGSVYATTGSVINGPAPRALKSYPVSLTGNILTITF
jgi:cytochrome b6-f complex iron-sulfur subunit